MSRFGAIGSAIVTVALAACGRAGMEPDSKKALGSARWGGDYFPNVTLTTHTGETVRFFDDLIEGKVVVVNFIYTTCPDACPLETARLAEVQAILGDRVGRDTFFYSISIDPETDTPEVLAEYARRYGAGPGWLFLTGRASDVALLRTKLGLYDPEGETNLSQHRLTMLIGNQATGRWMKASPMENPYVLATQIGDWLHNWKQPRDPQRDYANAPPLRNLARGEGLFRTRCAACHAIGSPDPDAHAIGPDLLGTIERRERRWLVRWLAEPDEMLAENDPVARRLYEEFNHVPMPNMRLGAKEIEELLDFIEAETHRVRAARPGAQTVAASTGAPLRACCQKNASPPAAAENPQAAQPPATAARRKGPLHLPPLSTACVALGAALGVFTAFLRWRAATSCPRTTLETSGEEGSPDAAAAPGHSPSERR
jgi:protein SCO1/2